jgi:hypothetical protein
MSSQSFIGYAIIIVFSLVIWGIAGYIVDILVPWGNIFLNGFAQSQDSMDAAYFIIQVIISSPFIGLLLWGYDHLNNANTQSGGDR